MGAWKYIVDKLPGFSHKVKGSNAKHATKLTAELCWEGNTEETEFDNIGEYVTIVRSSEELRSSNFGNAFSSEVLPHQAGEYNFWWKSRIESDPNQEISVALFINDTKVSTDDREGIMPFESPEAMNNFEGAIKLETGDEIEVRIANFTSTSPVTVTNNKAMVSRV